MSTKRVLIESAYVLEGVLREADKDKGVVICHPHPLYGGSMDSNVVYAIERGFQEKGFTTLRFNFRGVGESQGYYDEGEGEVDDLVAAFEYLTGDMGGDAKILLAGYSFGAWICGKASARKPDIGGLLLVSYPFAFYPPDEIRMYRGPVYLIGGEHDDICPLESLLKFYKDQPVIKKHLKVIPTDHFYWGKEQEITDFISEVIT